MDLTEDDVTQILKLIDGAQFDEIEIEWKGLKLHLRRGGGVARGEAITALPASDAASARSGASEKTERAEPAASPREESAPAEPTLQTAENEIPPGVDVVRSPMMGTFYRSPEPGAAPFVEEGARVEEGQTVCLIEVMKVYNAVTADRSGVVEKVCVDDGALVEFEQPILYLRRDEA